jgi:hypothetical protein
MPKRLKWTQKKVEARKTAELRQIARTTSAYRAKSSQQRVPARSRAKINYLLMIEKDVFE